MPEPTVPTDLTFRPDFVLNRPWVVGESLSLNLRDSPLSQLHSAFREKLESNPAWQPTLGEVQTLLCRTAQSMGEVRHNSGELLPPLPFPEISNTLELPLSPSAPVQPPGHNIDSQLPDLLIDLANRLDTPTRLELTRYILSHRETLDRYIHPDLERDFLYSLAINYLSDTDPSAPLLGEEMVRYVSSFREEKLPNSPHSSGDHDSEYMFMFHLKHSPAAKHILYRGLATGDYTLSQKRKIIGLVSREITPDLSAELNTLRSLMSRDDLPVGETNQYAHMLRDLLGLLSGINSEDIAANPTLDELYDHIDWHLDETSLALQRDRTNRILEIMSSHSIAPSDPILDLGCGAGWLTANLGAAGYRETIGIDHSPKNIADARRLHPALATRFSVGDWGGSSPNHDSSSVWVPRSTTSRLRKSSWMYSGTSPILSSPADSSSSTATTRPAATIGKQSSKQGMRLRNWDTGRMM